MTTARGVGKGEKGLAAEAPEVRKRCLGLIVPLKGIAKKKFNRREGASTKVVAPNW